jgi:hypothetical protein
MTSAMTALANTTLSATATSVNFASIPTSGYKDLILIANFTQATTAGNLAIRLRGDTTASYGVMNMRGDGSSASSNRPSSSGYSNSIELNYSLDIVNSTRAQSIITIPSYAQSSYIKTVIARTDNSSLATIATVGQWNSSNTVTSVNIFTSGNFAAGSTFALYGIAG